MKKSFLGALLCAIVVMALLTLSAMAVEDISSSALDLLSNAPAVVTTYKAGSGTVTWDPTVTPATLTFDGATMNVESLAYFPTPAVNLPSLAGGVNVVFKGTNSITATNENSAVVLKCNGITAITLMPGSDTTLNAGDGKSHQPKGIYCASPKGSEALTVTGSGKLTVNAVNSESSAAYAIDASTVLNHPVALTGGTLVFTGKVTGDVTLGGVTIADDTIFNLENAQSVTKGATGAVNNGTLVLHRRSNTNEDIANIGALYLTGSGIVQAIDGTSNYYDNDGKVLYSIGGAIDFSKSPEAGNWNNKTTVEESGYEFSGDSTNGYTLKLGNLFMINDGNPPCIGLPGDGPVEVVLVDGTTTRITGKSRSAMFFSKTGDDAYPCIITGNGRLILKSSGTDGCLYTQQPLTIAGGDISITGYSGPGIDADDTELTISGGKLKIAATDKAVKATELTLNNMVITSPAGAAFNPKEKSICDANGNFITNVTMESVAVTTVTVDTYTLTFNTNGGSEIFSVSETGGTIVDLSAYKTTKIGHSFDGWYSNSRLTNKVTSIKLNKDTTVYAKWTVMIVIPEMPFEDVPEDAYYRDAVIWAVDEGITEGTGATTFSPDGICTRAQAVTFLWRASGSPEPTTTAMPFNDVPADSYYYKAVLWAVEQGIINGTSETTFSPDMNCSRAQIVTMLWRMEGAGAAAAANPFTDVSGDAYYVDAVLWAVDEEITLGTSATTFSPDDNCTRAQIVTFIYRDVK